MGELTARSGILFGPQNEPALLKTTPPLPRYERAKQPPRMRLTERDRRILLAVHEFEGLLADYQIRRLFFTGRAQMQHRTKLLYQNRYLARPGRRQRAALPHMVYWLDKAGAEVVAGTYHEDADHFTYLKEPRWSLAPHLLAVNDFRLDVLKACAGQPRFTFAGWVTERDFRAYPDQVDFTDRQGKAQRRKVIPDGFFILAEGQQQLRYFLELDRATHHLPRFVLEKVLPGLAYLRSEAYAQRFGKPGGAFLVVVDAGMKRLAGLKGATERAAGRQADRFYFTTRAQVRPETVLTAPIWYRGTLDRPVPLLKVA